MRATSERDLVAENFGLLIAYLAPGLLALAALSFAYEPFGTWFRASAGPGTSVGSAFVLFVAAAGMGVAVQGARWVLFENVLLKMTGPAAPDWSDDRMEDPDVRSRMAELRDQHYRYYQFYAGLAVALLLLGVAALGASAVSFGWRTTIPVLAAELVLVFSARHTLTRYYDKGSRHMNGGPDDERRAETGRHGEAVDTAATATETASAPTAA